MASEVAVAALAGVTACVAAGVAAGVVACLAAGVAAGLAAVLAAGLAAGLVAGLDETALRAGLAPALAGAFALLPVLEAGALAFLAAILFKSVSLQRLWVRCRGPVSQLP